MNDPYRQRSPDGFDDDAIFADIIAHMNDVATELGPAARPSPEEAATDIEAPDQPPEAAPSEAAEETAWAASGATAEPTQVPPADEPHDSQDDPDELFINQLPQPSTQAEAENTPDPQVWRANEVVDEPEEHFEPPPTTPLPPGDLQFWAIIAGMSGGPLLLLYLVFFNREASGYWILAAIAMSVGGFALLVSRMPGHQDDDDDGARL
ncbi:MAG: hypothetical protein QOE58_2901 [Actinomycetota bacterium]|nr:hypothetical protein [Actinomycetota bacterium]